MTKKLSKKLCELCGVEAKYKLKCERPCPIIDKKQYDAIDSRWSMTRKKDYNEVTVDFGNAENFVGLLEILTTELRKVSFESNGIVCINDGDGEGYSLAEATISFIQVAYEEADEEEDYVEVTLLKQAIQGRKWVV